MKLAQEPKKSGDFLRSLVMNVMGVLSTLLVGNVAFVSEGKSEHYKETSVGADWMTMVVVMPIKYTVGIVVDVQKMIPPISNYVSMVAVENAIQIEIIQMMVKTINVLQNMVLMLYKDLIVLMVFVNHA